jgi:dienelactone hydrolase
MAATRKKYLGEVGGLEAPLLMHLGEEDEFISKTAQAEIKAALAKKPNATVYSYPGQSRAFLSAQWGALRRGGGSASEPANKRISSSTTAVSFGRSTWEGSAT